MIATVNTLRNVGKNTIRTFVEVSVTEGIGIHVVGLTDENTKNSLLRTSAALQTMGYKIPGKKIIINITPSAIVKKNIDVDLPMAIGTICASGQESLPRVGDFFVVGALDVNGKIVHVAGAERAIELARACGRKGVILPYDTKGLDTMDTNGVEVYLARNMKEAIGVLKGEAHPEMLLNSGTDGNGTGCPAFEEIPGCESEKRKMLIAAAGGHSMILAGDRALRKKLVNALVGILPGMSIKEKGEILDIYDASETGKRDLLDGRPLRTPPHTVSMPTLLGRKKEDGVVPGEVSLAHGGVLYLDDLPRMSMAMQDCLSMPLTDGTVALSYMNAKRECTRWEYPSNFMLIAGMSTCPCGNESGKNCNCTPRQKELYTSNISNMLKKRIDMKVTINEDKHAPTGQEETSEKMRKKLQASRDIQRKRFKGTSTKTNAGMTKEQISTFCALDNKCIAMLEELSSIFRKSMKPDESLLKIARTIADLDKSKNIKPKHIAEAFGCRQ